VTTEFSATAATGVGVRTYWDDGAKNATSTSSSNTPIGTAVAVAANYNATVALRLHV
jgi:predicted RecA/RadA family phage recombinase